MFPFAHQRCFCARLVGGWASRHLPLTPPCILTLQVDPLGGGRIEHWPDQGVLSIYGYSAAFGPAPHEVSCAIVRDWYPFYDDNSVSVSYDGY